MKNNDNFPRFFNNLSYETEIYVTFLRFRKWEKIIHQCKGDSDDNMHQKNFNTDLLAL